MAKPTANQASPVKEFIDQRYEELAEAQGLLDGDKIQVNIRLPDHAVFYLQVIADKLQMSRPAAAASLLYAAIEEACGELKISLNDKAIQEKFSAFKADR